MKLVREHIIFEKFSEEGDPIHDMNIGLNAHRNFSSYEELREWLLEYIPFILGLDKMPGDIIYHEYHVPSYPWKYYTPIREFVEKYHTVNGQKAEFSGMNHVRLKEILLSMGYPKEISEKPLDEKFTEEGDPIHDMGIGRNVVRNFDSEDELVNWFVDHIPMILKTVKIPKNVLSRNKHIPGVLYNSKYFAQFCDYIDTYIRLRGEKLNFHEIKKGVHAKLLKLGFEHNDYSTDVNEKFTEDGDPIRDMGIGMREKLKKSSLAALKGKNSQCNRIAASISNYAGIPEEELYKIELEVGEKLLIDAETIKSIENNGLGQKLIFMKLSNDDGFIVIEKPHMITSSVYWGDFTAASKAYEIQNKI